MLQHFRCLWEEYFFLRASRSFVLIKDENVFALSQQWSTGTLCEQLRRATGVIFQRKRLVISAQDLRLLGRLSRESSMWRYSICRMWTDPLNTTTETLQDVLGKKKKRESKYGYGAFNCRYLSLQTFIHLLYLGQ